MMRILVADDHAMFGEALHYLLKSIDPALEVRAVNSVAAALDAIVSDGAPDLVLLDYAMPDLDGLQGIDSIRAVDGTVRIAMLSGNTDPIVVRSALAKGVLGWIPKSLPPATLIHALRLMMAGQRFVPPELLETAPLMGLSEREGQVALLLAQGNPDKVIAERLGIEPATARVHVRRILKKSGAANRTQYAAMVRS
ncbi:two component transcriptional regulator, LuxR family [Devosia lucknowensis]|uniref:Two component transcriptional regulator, LuxR family n=1 Tax=Devosia lucknowensis TaxID=1096929 RepID=A0A1Y6ECX0_9HYPH|nr:response regulator transcription factor [Devosia lucknowensis]SMQ58760.1 two component transcriptional regulator, LuxR family [Devosia lucknowensis]